MKRGASESDVREEARALYAAHSNDDIEVAEGAEVSRAEDGSGAFVQAWLWVAFDADEEGEP